MGVTPRTPCTAWPETTFSIFAPRTARPSSTSPLRRATVNGRAFVTSYGRLAARQPVVLRCIRLHRRQRPDPLGAPLFGGGSHRRADIRQVEEPAERPGQAIGVI